MRLLGGYELMKRGWLWRPFSDSGDKGQPRLRGKLHQSGRLTDECNAEDPHADTLSWLMASGRGELSVRETKSWLVLLSDTRKTGSRTSPPHLPSSPLSIAHCRTVLNLLTSFRSLFSASRARVESTSSRHVLRFYNLLDSEQQSASLSSAAVAHTRLLAALRQRSVEFQAFAHTSSPLMAPTDSHGQTGNSGSRRVLFVTVCLPSEQSDWHTKMEEYCSPLPNHLRAAGASVAFASILDPILTPDYLATSYDSIMCSSLDGYTKHYAAFLSFMRDTLPAARQANPRLRVVNHESALVWNSDKRYLAELQLYQEQRRSTAGATSSWRVPRTEYLEFTQPTEDAFASFQSHLRTSWASEAITRPVVLKSSVSASGTSTHLIKNPHRLSAGDRAWLTGLSGRSPAKAAGSLILQEFLDGILRSSPGGGGEWSVVYVGGECTHVARKLPHGDEYRVNSAMQGKGTPYPPNHDAIPPSALAAAAEVWDYLQTRFPDGAIAFARIDGVVQQNAQEEFVIMEIEAIEPYLWLKEGEEQTGGTGRAPGTLAARKLCELLLV